MTLNDCDHIWEYHREQLEPLRHLIANNKVAGKLLLDDAGMRAVESILFDTLKIQVNLDHELLSVMEILDVVLSLFLNHSSHRAFVLGVSAGALRVSAMRMNMKMDANNRLHALYLMQKAGVIS